MFGGFIQGQEKQFDAMYGDELHLDIGNSNYLSFRYHNHGPIGLPRYTIAIPYTSTRLYNYGCWNISRSVTKINMALAWHSLGL